MSSSPSDPTIDLAPSNGSTSDETAAPEGPPSELVAILDQFIEDLQAGRRPDRARLLAEHPALATHLEACLAGIEFVHGATAAEPGDDQPALLGEFRIVRELGRGGMGVVYEAEQQSLRRRVALKVLRFGVVADPEAMQRFQREAETVARLHHTNIVPIFAVGCERGVHFYAMQLIDGRSLADVQAEAQNVNRVLAAEEVARWGLQAAEALWHAHHRGVIHRDIKPSNLLLDREGIVWLTDFGLAKRADEVTMTVSGALMGTPRYMSPEQAEAVRRPVDHRTDLYSLGATLYELATGQPLFNATTTHGLLAQILTEEPPRPRTLRAGIPRDLETVILTCLAKDPARRYKTAQALADDLRAVLDGRPIQARRAPWTERLARSIRKHQKAVKVAVTAVAASLIVVAGLYGGWRWYSDWRLGRALLSTDGPPLTAEVLPAEGENPLVEPFTIGTRTALALPAGDYRLRLNAPGRRGRTYRLGLNRGEMLTRTVSLDEGLLYGPEAFPFVSNTEAVCFAPGTKADLVEWTGQTLVRREGATGKPVWDLARPAKAWPQDRDPLAWMRRLFNRGNEQQPGRIVVPAPDLNGDGVGDLVLAFSGTPSLLALSGQDGAFLWATNVTDDGPRPPDATPRMGWFVGPPIATDVDGDGTPDLVGTVVLASEHRAENGVLTGGKGRRMVTAASGKDGRGLWIQPIDLEPRELTLGDDRSRAALIRGPGGPWIGALGPLPGAGSAAETGCATWRVFALATGTPLREPIDLGFTPVRPFQLADLDGDGSDELLGLGPGTSAVGVNQDQALSAIAAASGRTLWTVRIRGGYQHSAGPVRPEWPLVADLDGDGRAEVAVPDWGRFPSKGAYRGVALLDGSSGKVRWSQALRPWTADATDLQHLSAGPDLDGDGVRDLVAVSRFRGRRPFATFSGQRLDPSRLYVDALSGQTGKSLWCWNREMEDQAPMPGPARWWGLGPQGGLLLAVSVSGIRAHAFGPVDPNALTVRPEVHVLAAASGREVSSVVGLSAPRFDDLDGDGLADLWGEAEGRLRAYRGEAPEAWRALGHWTPAGDLDGDGVADVLTGALLPPPIRTLGAEEPAESRTLAARSGRDGRELWRTLLDRGRSFVQPYTSYRFIPFPEGGGDFDGDGAADVVARMESPRFSPQEQVLFELRSGRNGRRLWSAPTLPAPVPKLPEGYEAFSVPPLAQSDLAGVVPCEIGETGRPDLLVLRMVRVTLRPIGVPLPPGSVLASAVEYRLSRLSGRDGRVAWDVPLDDVSLKYGFNHQFPHAIGDLDGDGSPEIVVPVQVGAEPLPTAIAAPTTIRFRLVAVSLRDGTRRWTRPLRYTGGPASFRVGDLDGDGRAEVVVADQPASGAKEPVEILALDGRDGALRWSWRGGNESDPFRLPDFPFRLAAFDGNGGRTVCVNIGRPANGRALMLLDSKGHERASRTTDARWWTTLEAADLDGDGRDEILWNFDSTLRAGRGNLEALWSRPYEGTVRNVLPACAGVSGTVVIEPSIGLDGASGRPRWSGLGGSLLVFDPGTRERPPLLFTENAHEFTCRSALATDPSGRPVLPAAVLAPGSRDAKDPRWRRPLPWSLFGSFSLHPLQLLFAGGVALVVLVIPVGIVRLATRRRTWGLPLLLSLPVAFGIPLAALVAARTLIPSLSESIPAWGIVLGALGIAVAGLPVLLYPWALVADLLGRRWNRLATLLGLTLIATVVAGGYMVRADLRIMPEIEFFDWSEWYGLLPIGAYIAGLLLLAARLFGQLRGGARRWLGRRGAVA